MSKKRPEAPEPQPAFIVPQPGWDVPPPPYSPDHVFTADELKTVPPPPGPPGHQTVFGIGTPEPPPRSVHSSGMIVFGLICLLSFLGFVLVGFILSRGV